MNFSKAVKVFELNIMRQMGVMVTPQQVGLKSDPIADLQAKSLTNNSFNMLLNRMGMTTPTAPTPPSDLTDTKAVAAYQQELQAYTQNMQLYNQRFMQMMLSQMQQMQQTMAQNARTQSTSNSNSSTADSSLGMGGIL